MCKKRATVSLSYTPRRYCDRDFLILLGKRVRKNIRMRKEILPKKRYVLKGGGKELAIARYFLKDVFGEHLLLVRSRGKMIIPTNMDRENARNLAGFLENRNLPKKNGILFLDDVLDEEMCIIARILRIRGGKEKSHQLIDDIDRKHPGSRFALKQSLDGVKS
jgi:hypothetical protein